MLQEEKYVVANAKIGNGPRIFEVLKFVRMNNASSVGCNVFEMIELPDPIDLCLELRHGAKKYWANGEKQSVHSCNDLHKINQ